MALFLSGGNAAALHYMIAGALAEACRTPKIIRKSSVTVVVVLVLLLVSVKELVVSDRVQVYH